MMKVRSQRSACKSRKWKSISAFNFQFSVFWNFGLCIWTSLPDSLVVNEKGQALAFAPKRCNMMRHENHR